MPADTAIPETLPTRLQALFLAFLRLGLTAFGGPAMIVYIRELAVVKKGWLSGPSFQQGLAICQIIPGATAIQAVAYIGLRHAGGWGAVAAYTAFALPAFLFMTVLTALYQQAQQIPAMVSAFAGLQVIVVALVAQATVSFGKNSLRSGSDVLLAAATAAFLLAGGNPLLAIFLAAACGQLLYRSPAAATSGTASFAPNNPSLADFRLPLLLSLLFLLFLLALFLFDRQLGQLALVMARVDLFAFGGGYGSVPLLFDEVVAVRGWLPAATLMDGIALGQVTPGPIVITATFVGYLLAALPGALVATVSIFTPSLILLTAAVPSFDRIKKQAWLPRATRAVSASFVGLLTSVTIRFALAIAWTPLSGLLAAAAFAALWRKIDILYVVSLGALLAALVL